MTLKKNPKHIFNVGSTALDYLKSIELLNRALACRHATLHTFISQPGCSGGRQVSISSLHSHVYWDVMSVHNWRGLHDLFKFIFTYHVYMYINIIIFILILFLSNPPPPPPRPLLANIYRGVDGN